MTIEGHSDVVIQTKSFRRQRTRTGGQFIISRSTSNLTKAPIDLVIGSTWRRDGTPATLLPHACERRSIERAGLARVRAEACVFGDAQVKLTTSSSSSFHPSPMPPALTQRAKTLTFVQGAKLSELELLGTGDGGIDEMRGLLSDDTVQWAIFRIETGSGSFRRQKLIFVHFNGEDCPAVKRGQLNACTAEVQRILRGGDDTEGFHASIEVKKKDEMTEEVVKEKLTKYFVTDHLGDHSVSWKMCRRSSDICHLQRRHAAPATAGVEDSGVSARVPDHDSHTMFACGRAALRSVADPMGAWTWVLLGPNPDELPVVAGGSGSVTEVQEYMKAHDDLVCFGLLRLEFGEGRLRRVKYVFLHVIGENVPVVRRGRLAFMRPAFEKVITGLQPCSLHVVDARPENLDADEVMERVRKAVIVDDDILNGDGGSFRKFSLHHQREESRVSSRSSIDTVESESQVIIPAKPDSDRRTEDIVRLVHAPAGTLNWALFGVSGCEKPSSCNAFCPEATAAMGEALECESNP